MKEGSPLLGQGLLAIWNSLEPKDEAIFDRWYTQEHVPERLATPGFRRGRRYSASSRRSDRLLEYMTFYETDDSSVLGSASYLERLNHPTELTVQVLPLLQQVVRAACSTVLSRGRGIGGQLGSIRFDFGQGPLSEEIHDWLAGPGVTYLLEDPEIVGVHYCVTDIVTTVLKDQTREQAAGNPASRVHSLLLIEATSRRGLASALHLLPDPAQTLRSQEFGLMVCLESDRSHE